VKNGAIWRLAGNAASNEKNAATALSGSLAHGAPERRNHESH